MNSMSLSKRLIISEQQQISVEYLPFMIVRGHIETSHFTSKVLQRLVAKKE